LRPRIKEVDVTPSPLIKKLRIQPGQQLLVLNAPPGYIESLGELPEGARLSEQPDPQAAYDFCHLFAKNSPELADLVPTAVEAIRYDGLLWVSYPKKSSKVKTDLSRDTLWELPGATGLRPVTQVSIDGTWSAIRFRPSEQVGR
jgi:hypothetical protein